MCRDWRKRSSNFVEILPKSTDKRPELNFNSNLKPQTSMLRDVTCNLVLVSRSHQRILIITADTALFRSVFSPLCVYLSNCCIPVAQVATRRHLRSAARHQLTVPRHRLITYGRRAFAVAGPTTVPCQMICETPLSAMQPSDNCWKHTFSLPISTFGALRVSHVMRYINLTLRYVTLRYLLTYLLSADLSFSSN